MPNKVRLGGLNTRHTASILKFDAAAKQVSQFEPAVNKYRPDWTPEDLKKAKNEMRKEQPKKDGHYVEAFRYAIGFVQY